MDYHKCQKEYIGFSDVASLVVRTLDEQSMQKLHLLEFAGDGSYSAYIADSKTEIGKHYSLVCEGHYWMWIYSDDSRVSQFDGNIIRVYRAGGYGCIIQILD